MRFIYLCAMCYNLSYYERKMRKYMERYGMLVPESDLKLMIEFDEKEFNYFVSGFSHPDLPLITEKGFSFYKWGLIPSWVKDFASAKELRTKTLNAVGETAFEKPSFRSAIKSRRGLLPVSGFFEWMDFNKKKYPFFIRLKEEDLFSLGCVYETWTDKSTGEIYNTFSIVTTPANQMMEKIHNTKKRMPLILPKEQEANWIDSKLSPEQIKELIKPFDERLMTAHTISTDANSGTRNRNREDITSPVEYPELALLD